MPKKQLVDLNSAQTEKICKSKFYLKVYYLLFGNKIHLISRYSQYRNLRILQNFHVPHQFTKVKFISPKYLAYLSIAKVKLLDMDLNTSIEFLNSYTTYVGKQYKQSPLNVSLIKKNRILVICKLQNMKRTRDFNLFLFAIWNI